MPRSRYYSRSGYGYRRRGGFRRRTALRRPRYQKPMRYQVADMAYSGYRLALKLAKYVNAEEKFHDATLTGSSVDYTTGVVSTLNSIAQGDTDETRDGDSVKLTRLTGSIQVSGNAAANTVIRYWIVWDPMNTITTLANFWETGAATSVLGNKDHDHRFQTRVLHDSGPLPLVVANDSYVRIDPIAVKIFKHTQFEAGTTTINSGALKLFAISDQANASNEPTIRAQLRVHYIDN